MMVLHVDTPKKKRKFTKTIRRNTAKSLTTPSPQDVAGLPPTTEKELSYETVLTSVDVAEEQLCVDSVIDDMLYEIRGEVRRQQRCAHSSLSELTVIGDKEKMRTISPEREELVRAQLTDRYRAAMRRNVTRREFLDRLMAFI